MNKNHLFLSDFSILMYSDGVSPVTRLNDAINVVRDLMPTLLARPSIVRLPYLDS